MSSTEIINMALDLLDEEPMLMDGDDRAVIRWFSRNYAPVRDSLIRSHPWNFAKAHASLDARTDETGPSFNFKYAYPLPCNCVRVLPLADLGERNGAQVDFEVRGRDIHTDAKAPLRVMYLASVEDTGMMDPMFVQYLAATLAARAASYVTGKQSYAERLMKMAEDSGMEAKRINALESVPETTYEADWAQARSSYDSYWGRSA